MRGTTSVLNSSMHFATLFPMTDGSCVLPGNGGTQLIAADKLLDTVKDFKVVRIHAYKHAIPVICRLYETNAETPSLVVGSPQAVSHLLAKSAWDEALSASMRLETLPASMGGWRRMSTQDYDVFSLVRDGTDNVQSWARHPAAKVVHFIAECNRGSTSAGLQLVSEIIDPRWFVDPNRPNNNNRLYAYLGALPSNARDVLSDKFSVRTRRAKLLTSWCLGDRTHKTPWSFLTNMFLAGQDEPKSWLNVTRLAIDMLKAAWLDAMSPDRDLFVPRYAFSFFPNGPAMASRYDRFKISYHNG